MADGLEVERGFKYHANFIYNQPKLKNNRHKNPDWETSLAVVKFIVELMRKWRYDKTYYHDRDALPGSNVFTEFFTAVNKASFTIVIVTKGFVEDCWGRYKSQAAFIKLLENSKSNRLIGVYVDIDDHHIPQELSTMVHMAFSANWKNETEEWNKLRNLISPVPTPIQDTGPDRSTINTELQHLERNPTSGLHLQDGNIMADGPSSLDVALTTIPSGTQPHVDDTQNLSTNRNSDNNHSLNDNQESLRSPGPATPQSMGARSTSSEESTTNRPASNPSGIPTTSNRSPPDGEANATTFGLAQGQRLQTMQREDSLDIDVKRLVIDENQDGDDLIDSSLKQSNIEADNQASGQWDSVDTPAPQMPSVAAKLERLKFDDNDQEDSGFLDLTSLQMSDNSLNISPESIGANIFNDQTPSPTTAGYRSPVQTPTSKGPDNPSFYN